MLVILTLGGTTTAVAVSNPPLGVAIGIGMGVVGLLHKLMSEGRDKR
jgi:hypothetical protein